MGKVFESEQSETTAKNRDDRLRKGGVCKGNHGNRSDMPTNLHAVSEVNSIVNALVRCGVAFFSMAMISMIVECWASSSINIHRTPHSALSARTSEHANMQQCHARFMFEAHLP